MSDHKLTPSRSHALIPCFGIRARVADLLRGHGDLPAAPGLILPPPSTAATSATRVTEPGPPWSGASVTAGNPLPALARAYVPRVPSEVIPAVPLTEPARIFEEIGGEERTARPCTWCGALSGRTDFSWRYDALGHWSCPACQMSAGWHAPMLPGVPAATEADDAEAYGGPETGILARSLLGTDPRCVRQRPDGRWAAAVKVGGRRKVLGSFGSKEEAEDVYGAVLNAFAAAAVA